MHAIISVGCHAWLVLMVGIGAACVDGTAPTAQHSHVFHEDLAPTQIPPMWVLSGQPQARVKLLAAASDEGMRAALWDCSAGKFKWHFRSDELVHILDGEVRVTDAGGSSRTLKTGDVAYFAAGTDSIWHVDRYVKKLAVLRDNRESIVDRAQRKLNQLFASR